MEQKRAGKKAGLFRRRQLRAFAGSGLPRIFLILSFASTPAFVPRLAAGQDSAGEYEVKAAMLYNLTRFVEWPPLAYANTQAPTILCILGRDPFGDALTSIASEQTANGARTVELRHPQNDKGVRSCHVLYISSSERKNIDQIFATLKGSHVLTVGEITQFAARGGMIQFSLEEKQVRFEINLDAASQAELRISSRLLMLARIVKDENRNRGREGSTTESLWAREVYPPPPANNRELASTSAEVSGIAGDEPRRSR